MKPPVIGVIAENSKYFVEVVISLESGLTNVLWEKNQKGFSELNANSIARQNMTRDEFIADATDQRVLKYIVYAKSNDGDKINNPDAAVGMLFVYSDARDVGWINQHYMRKELPGFSDGKFCYVSTLVIDHDHRGLEASVILIKAVGRHLMDQGHGLIDFAQANSSLPKRIQLIFSSEQFGRTLPLKLERLGQENYMLVDPTGMPETSSDKSTAEGSTQDRIDSQAAETLWEKYESRTTGIDHKTPARQSLNKQEFLSYCRDPRVLKILTNGPPGTELIFLASTPAHSEHLSEAYAHANAGKPVKYILGAGALEPVANDPHVEAALNHALLIAKRDSAALAYQADSGASNLEHTIERLAGKLPLEIDHQSYWVVKKIGSQEQ